MHALLLQLLLLRLPPFVPIPRRGARLQRIPHSAAAAPALRPRKAQRTTL